ncbi:MAG TPA: polysaccharide deacetylase family protein [Candidatus Limnocylindrales bacterium]|nr:polysaccharide deacetylase family protein [Candidatus Limnocylindrales bacterium]
MIGAPTGVGVDGLLTLMYHYVRPPDMTPAVVASNPVSPRRFEAQLELLTAERTVVGWSAVAAALAGGPPLPGDACLLTFDDGLDDHHRVVLPILARRGLPAVFFIMARDAADGLALGHRLHVLLAALGADRLREAVLEGLEPDARARFAGAERERLEAGGWDDPLERLKHVLQRELAASVGPVLGRLIAECVGPEDEIAEALYLDGAQQAELAAAGMTLGGHGREHHWLDFVAPSEVDAELDASRRRLEALGVADKAPFAYPYGGVPAGAARVLPAHGFAAAFLARPSGGTDRFALGRVDAEDDSAFERALRR